MTSHRIYLIVDLIFTPFMLVLGQFAFTSPLLPKVSCPVLFCRCQPLLTEFPRLHEHWLTAVCSGTDKRLKSRGKGEVGVSYPLSWFPHFSGWGKWSWLSWCFHGWPQLLVISEFPLHPVRLLSFPITWITNFLHWILSVYSFWSDFCLPGWTLNDIFF